MATRSPTTSRGLFSGIVPLLSVEKEFQRFVAPQTNVFSTLAKRAVEMAFGQPFINRLHAVSEKLGELRGRQYGRDTLAVFALKRGGDFGVRKVGSSWIHGRSPEDTNRSCRQSLQMFLAASAAWIGKLMPLFR